MIPIPKSGNRLRSCGWSRDQVAQSAFARGPAAAEARGCGELRCPQEPTVYRHARQQDRSPARTTCSRYSNGVV